MHIVSDSHFSYNSSLCTRVLHQFHSRCSVNTKPYSFESLLILNLWRCDFNQINQPNTSHYSAMSVYFISQIRVYTKLHVCVAVRWRSGWFYFALLRTQIHAHAENYVFSGFTFPGTGWQWSKVVLLYDCQVLSNPLFCMMINWYLPNCSCKIC